mgnify:CR=1 FL=1
MYSMDINKAKKLVSLKDYVLTNTTSKIDSKSGNTVNLNPCPICNHNDCFRIYPNTNSWKCFSGDHDSGGSIVDFIMEYDNLENKQAIKKVIELAGGENYDRKQKQVKETKKTSDSKNKITSSLIEKYHDNVNKTDYFKKRGIDKDLIDKYKLGYDEKYNTVTLPCYKEEEPVFMVKRYINPRNNKYHNIGGTELFNADILDSDQEYIYITEGIFDALSVEKATGKQAIALNSTSNTDKLIKLIENKNIKDKHFKFIGDNDSAGKKAKKKFDDLSFIETHTLNEYEDPNEYLKNEEKNSLKNELQGQSFNISFIENFFNDINENKGDLISTGFDNFDNILQGGLFPGLYVIGAISSLGKTTFCLQVADQIANKDNDVIFFSLEQSRTELMSKSISRKINDIDNNKIINTMDMLTGNIKPEDKKVFKNAVENYKNIAENLAIIEDVRDVNDISKEIERISKIRESKPVVFVDFLQIIQPPEKNMSYRQAVDFNLSELKRTSREYNVPIMLISSFNRQNYNNEVSFESFKESGSIEYTADVVIGLQLTKMSTTDNFNKKDVYNWKGENPRLIQAVILKYRNGPVQNRANYKFYPAYSKFEEIGVSK